MVTLNPYKHNISWTAYGLVFCLFAVTGAAQTIVTIAGDGVQGYAGDNGPAIQAQGIALAKELRQTVGTDIAIFQSRSIT